MNTIRFLRRNLTILIMWRQPPSAVWPERSLAEAKLGRSTMNPDSCCLLLQINMLDVLNWKSEKPLSEPLKFFGRVRREELQSRRGPTLLRIFWKCRHKLCKSRCDGACGGLGRIHNAHMTGRYTFQQRLEQGIMRAGQNHRVRVVESACECLCQVNARDLLGHCMLNPSFLHQRNQ